MKNKLKGGFTLIELLVVISIISMLSSVVLANVNDSRAKGRDSQRTQQVRQIDLATRLYMENEGHAPYLQDTCEALSKDPDQNAASACFAVSTSGVEAQQTAWEKLKLDLKPYIVDIPNDPCPSCTSEQSNYALGYTYVAPLYIQYQCNQSYGNSCPQSVEQLNQSYQVFAPLEKKINPMGTNQTNGNTSYDNFLNSPSFQKPNTPTNLSATSDSGAVILTWTISTHPNGIPISGYVIYKDSIENHEVGSSPSNSMNAVLLEPHNYYVKSYVGNRANFTAVYSDPSATISFAITPVNNGPVNPDGGPESYPLPGGGSGMTVPPPTYTPYCPEGEVCW